MASIMFTLREPNAKTPQIIYLTYRFGRNKKFRYSTGFKVAPKYWNKETQRIRNVIEVTDKNIINNRLNELKSQTEQYITELTAKAKTVNKELLSNFLDNLLNPSKIDENTFFGFYRKFIKESETRLNPKTGKRIGYKTQREYERTLYYLNEFKEKTNANIDFDTIDLEFYTNFVEYLQSVGLSTNTIGHKIQSLKAVLNEATTRGINNNLAYQSQRFRAVKENSESVYLTVDELEQLYNLDLSNNTRLDRVRDLFLLGAWTGLRFSDLTSIKSENIQDNFINIKQSKTGNNVIIPLNTVFTSIWNKYGGHLPPTISNQKFNEYLKEVCKLAKIDTIVYKSITKGGIKRSTTHKKYELISSHTARRSFATNLYKSGFPAISIMQITGHRTETAFLKYIKVTPKEHAKLLALHWQKQGSHLKVV